MYTGWMIDGHFIEWPVYESCMSDTGYDQRFRPWFANAATGPKDVIILIDTSGSMSTDGRMDLAISVAKQVLKTLTE